MNRYKRLSLLSLLSLLLLLGLAFPQSLAAEEKFLVFGRVHDDPVRSIRDRQEFVDYMAKKLAPLGITGGRIVVVEKMQLLARALREGKVDLFHDSVVPTMVLSKWAGSVPILRQWKYGEADYDGVILVKKNSGIETLADLKGRVIAFDEPHSTSAHILPRMLLEEKKLKLVQIKSPGTTKPDAVGYVYGTDGSSPNLLITGRADAATTSYREFERLKPEVQETLKIIGRTRTVPRQLIAVRKDLDSQIVKTLKEVLINMDKDPEGQGVMKRQQNTTKIDEIPPGSLSQLKYIERYVFSSFGKEVDSW
ncbi:MAG TPA: phosphate/phosphite/phosphonate ABC transporter substrate-binding protein [Candidatus Binatia bacterium]|nr:phosphate/phosphite/phosphonate ABC transporter substrate-binding protein [Candidatus Binatia bacterium]